jgi:sorbitol-specific phosphotransferase system component IIC
MVKKTLTVYSNLIQCKYLFLAASCSFHARAMSMRRYKPAHEGPVPQHALFGLLPHISPAELKFKLRYAFASRPNDTC